MEEERIVLKKKSSFNYNKVKKWKKKKQNKWNKSRKRKIIGAGWLRG